jgi:hypothetical protein
MMNAAQRWILTSLAGLSVFAVAAAAAAQQEQKEVKVTDADRVYANYTREAATVGSGNVRVELRAFTVTESQTGGNPDCRGPMRKNCARLNSIGQRIIGVEDVRAGRFDLLTSYGLGENAEIGMVVPLIIESITRDDGSGTTFEDIGDINLYGKFTQEVATNCSVGGGLELVFPPWKGLDVKTRTVQSGAGFGNPGSTTGTSTGELGMNPFLSSRYQKDRYAVGAHIGYTFYTGDEDEEVLNYSAHTILRGTDFYSFRLELNGRMWDQFGEKWHDVALLPGVDLLLAENFQFRPTFLAGLTNTAFDWGVGAGVAYTF